MDEGNNTGQRIFNIIEGNILHWIPRLKGEERRIFLVKMWRVERVSARRFWKLVNFEAIFTIGYLFARTSNVWHPIWSYDIQSAESLHTNMHHLVIMLSQKALFWFAKGAEGLALETVFYMVLANFYMYACPIPLKLVFCRLIPNVHFWHPTIWFWLWSVF